MRALLIDDLIQRGDVSGEQGINTTLLHGCHGVFCGLRHGAPLCAALDRLLAGTGPSTYSCQTETLLRIVLVCVCSPTLPVKTLCAIDAQRQASGAAGSRRLHAMVRRSFSKHHGVR
jgi:hypothetical protein